MGGDGGTGGSVACQNNVCPCNEEGILAAIEAGGDDPYTFDCEGPTTVTTQAEIVIDNDVILDGEGNLTVDADHPQRVFSVPEGVNAELHHLTATHWMGDDTFVQQGGGIANQGALTIHDCVISHNHAWSAEGFDAANGGGIRNTGQMTIINSTVSGNRAGHGWGGGISNLGQMTIINSTVSDNHAYADGSGATGGGIFNLDQMTIINSTVSDNSAGGWGGTQFGGGIANGGTLTLTHSTVWGNTASSGHVEAIAVGSSSYTEIANTLIDGDCARDRDEGTLVSNGYNIESPDDTCGFNQTGDQSGVSAVLLDLQPLANNGGPTQTHAITTDSAAFNAGTCEVDEDQRGVTRPQGPACDVGAFELEQ